MAYNIVYEDLNSFVRNQDPIKSLSLGYEAEIRNFFRLYNIDDEDYKVEKDGKIIFNTCLDLQDVNITELPDNLTINGYLNLFGANISKLPDNLTINGAVDFRYTYITKLSINIMIRGIIFVGENQIDLINSIKQNKFYTDKLRIIK